MDRRNSHFATKFMGFLVSLIAIGFIAACESNQVNKNKDVQPPAPVVDPKETPQKPIVKPEMLSCGTAVEGSIKPIFCQFDPEFKNAKSAIESPYVILVSIDGYRYDYATRYGATQLLDIAKRGVSTEGLIPVYPSKTFPNHYSIVTGLFADEHGIVSNEFYDPVSKESYKIGDASVVNGKWYSGEPLWITAQKNGFISASYFWVGSEAPIQGRYPNRFAKYKQDVPHTDRVDQVLTWLKLPADERPHFITLYFSDVDSKGHEFGPESKEVESAVKSIDAYIGDLRNGIKASGLPVNLIIVSDHGMQALDPSKVVVVGDKIDMNSFSVNGTGTMMKLYAKPGVSEEKINETVESLRGLSVPMRVYKRAEMLSLHYTGSDRIGDIIIEPDSPYLVMLKTPEKPITGANHGWDPYKFTNMHGVFYAEGPAFKQGVVLPAFQNVHVQPLVSHLLGFKKVPKTSGDINVTKPALAR